MHKIEKVLARILLVMLAIVGSFIVLEICANIFICHLASDRQFIKYASVRQLLDSKERSQYICCPHRYLGYYPTPNYAKGLNRHNAQGYRGDKEIIVPKPQGVYRIVCFGGSTTYTADVKDHTKSYPTLLEKHLQEHGFNNVEVINSGVPGWCSWESLLNLPLRVLELEPDMIIVYHGVNDVHPRMVWPSEFYRSDNSGRRSPNKTDLFMPGILEHSSFFRIIMVKWGLMEPHASFERTVDTATENYYARIFRRQKIDGDYPSGIFKEVSAAEMLKQNSPIYFERNIRNIVTLAEAHGIKVVLASFAHSKLFSDVPFASAEEYVSAYEEMSRLLQEISDSTDAHFFDFAGRFPEDKRYWTDGFHVNEEGAQLKAQLFGEFLIEHQLVAGSE